MINKNLYKDILFGVATGDALGVPVEFKSREAVRQNPVTDMIGYGTYDLPRGTWSDDSSLTFCLAEALTRDFSLQTIADHFIQWLYSDYWTPHGEVFDVGIATRHAIGNLKKGIAPELAGGFEEGDNGNGSLMHILPLLLYIKDKSIEERYSITKQVSSITHGHIRSVISCFYYLEFARLLANGEEKYSTFFALQSTIPAYLDSKDINPKEIALFNRLLKSNIADEKESTIQSTGYVLHTLEASIWCLLNTSSYKEAVLKAVNLGDDTDTTAAVAGGLAGILYGYQSIPKDWLTQLARKEEIEELCKRLEQKFT